MAALRPVFRRSVAVTGWVVIIGLSILVIEGVARLAFTYKLEIKSILGRIDPLAVSLEMLDDYEVRDPRHPANWIPKPGYRRTLEDLIQEKRRSNKPLAVQQLIETAERLGVKPTDVVMQVNIDGFKGPELDSNHSKVRILTIGDSCTFGTLFDWYSYPRTLERELIRRGIEAEVVNAGVEGYSPSNVALYRLEQFKSLRPEIVTLYIGWNALFSEDAYSVTPGIERYVYTVRLVKKALDVMETRLSPSDSAMKAYAKSKRPDKNAPILSALNGAVPSFGRDIEVIIDEMQSTGSVVVLITLPGLFSSHEEPTSRALQVGHLPPFTQNPYVLAKMAEVYNDWLRDLARRRGLLVVDLEKWSDRSLTPRDKFFFDSVHLYEEGQARIGRYLADMIEPRIREASAARQMALESLARERTNSLIGR